VSGFNNLRIAGRGFDPHRPYEKSCGVCCPCHPKPTVWGLKGASFGPKLAPNFGMN
jgi:hypothetical protein